jgi:hypothetical protein
MRVYGSRGTDLCRELSTIALAIGLAAGGSAPAMAQDQDDETSASASDDDSEIIVTGSRVGRSTFDTPNPVTVMNTEDIEDLGLNNVAEVVKQLPQNSNFFSANNVGLGNFNVGAQLVNLRGLNPFFGTRTLTLIDTRRVVPTTAGGGVDITLVPSMLVGRVETVTGGASAVYGSDAIAGVVNVILDKEFEGFKAQADFSATTPGDGDAPPYRAEAARLGLGARVGFPGWLDEKEAHERLSRAAVLVLPSEAEGLPMAVVEAFAWGVPVISTPVGSTPDILHDGVEGLMVPVGDADALAKALQRLIGDQALRQQLGANARACFARQLDFGPYLENLAACWRAAMPKN